jgi:nitrite reductase/ring-hydroxylating ferredoxin subunit
VAALSGLNNGGSARSSTSDRITGTPVLDGGPAATPEAATAATPDPFVPRRATLGAAIALTLPGALTACASAQPRPAPHRPPDTPPASAADPLVLTTTADVPLGDGVLVTQPKPGKFRAFDATCPHRGVQVSVPRDGVITCTAHNSRFQETDGAPISGPATGRLTRISVSVQGDTIVIP